MASVRSDHTLLPVWRLSPANTHVCYHTISVAALAADDYIYVGPHGLTLDREAILAIIRSPSYRLDHGTRSDVVVRAVGDSAAIVRHRYQGAGSFEGQTFTDDHRCVMIWHQHAGQWRLVMERLKHRVSRVTDAHMLRQIEHRQEPIDPQQRLAREPDVVAIDLHVPALQKLRELRLEMIEQFDAKLFPKIRRVELAGFQKQDDFAAKFFLC